MAIRTETTTMSFNVLPIATRSAAWVTQAIHDQWTPRIPRIQRMWELVERASIVEGVRGGGIFITDSRNATDIIGWAHSHNLWLRPLTRTQEQTTYSASSTSATSGTHFRMLAARKTELPSVYDDEDIGEILGYPDCCRAAFQRWWVTPTVQGQQWIDSTYPCYLENGTIDGPNEINILMRWLGVRFVPHLPCSTTCVKSVAFAQELITIGRKIDPDATEWALELLALPVKWDAYAGILELTTPIFRQIMQTDISGERRVLQRTGDIPSYAPSGLDSALFNTSKRKTLTSTTSFKNSITAGIPETSSVEMMIPTPATTVVPTTISRYFNGFGSLESMTTAHDALMAFIAECHREQLWWKEPEPRTWVDLGCGDGKLLTRLVDNFDGWVGVGIDSTRRPGLDTSRITFIEGSIQSVSQTGTVAIISARRFYELDDAQRKYLKNRLMIHYKHCVIYDYATFTPISSVTEFGLQAFDSFESPLVKAWCVW